MPKKPMRRRKDYEVGKGRPPKQTRWQPGQSGNPRGRPKGVKNLNTLVASALTQRITINEGGRRRTVTVREAITMRWISMALKGDYKTIMALLEMEPIEEPMKLPSKYEAILTDPNAIARVYANMVRKVRG